jgi:hypothetical protein
MIFHRSVPKLRKGDTAVKGFIFLVLDLLSAAVINFRFYSAFTNLLVTMLPPAFTRIK